MNSTNRATITLMGVLCATLLLPEAAMAQALFQSGTNFLDGLVDLLTGTWARAIGIIAVVFCGVMFVMGRMQWQFAAAVVVGLIMLFGAAEIVDSMSGTVA